MGDALENAVAELMGKIAERVGALQQDENWRELQRLYSGLGVLEELCGLPKTDLGSILGIVGDAGPKIEKYQFVGIPPLDAAKRYLGMIAPKQKAASLDEIISALATGGLTSVNRNDLRISLSRSTTEIYKAGEDIYGLLASFPQIKRGTPGRKKSANGAATVPPEGDAPEEATQTEVAPESTAS
jgi:hypothetical protein